MLEYGTDELDAVQQQIQATYSLIAIHKKMPPGKERDDLAVKIHELMGMHETAMNRLREYTLNSQGGSIE